MSGPKILCTGAGGFIFSNFVRYVRKNNLNYSIVSIDKCIHPKVLNTIYANKGCPMHIGDVADPHFVDIIFQIEKPDFVVHGAVEKSGDIIRSNVQGTQTIIDACIKYKIKKLIYVSDYKVYGSQGLGNENSELCPNNKYSATKLAGEYLIRVSGLHYNIIRPCNNYGPRQLKGNLIPEIIANILHNREVPIHDQGMQMRDWIHVQDTCTAILNVLEKAPTGEIYNISAKQEFRNIEVFQEICNILGRGHELISFIKGPESAFCYAITNVKIKALGWEPSFKFKDGLKHVVKWYENNLWFLKD